jgi:hypothetical protein
LTSPNNVIQSEYNSIVKNYDLNYPSNYTLNVRNSTDFIPVHSSSTQNSIFWKERDKDPLYDLITLVDHRADLENIGGVINKAIDNNNIDNLLNEVEVEETKKNPHYLNNNALSSYVNIFSRKYPSSAIVSKLANIDPEYIVGGLRGDSKILN